MCNLWEVSEDTAPWFCPYGIPAKRDAWSDVQHYPTGLRSGPHTSGEFDSPHVITASVSAGHFHTSTMPRNDTSDQVQIVCPLDLVFQMVHIFASETDHFPPIKALFELVTSVTLSIFQQGMEKSRDQGVGVWCWGNYVQFWLARGA